MSHAPALDVDAWRARIPLLERLVVLANCSHAPPLDSVVRALADYERSWHERGMDWDAWIEQVEGARAAFARLIGARPDEVAVVGSVSHAASALATALDFGGPRTTILASPSEFPTVGHVWLAQERRGARVRWLERGPAGTAPVEAYRAALDERTALVSVAHGDFQTGALQDVAAVAEAAREVGALTFVDAYQTAGTRPLDVEALGADALASGTLKYLLGLPGIAFLWVRPELAERLRPTVTGWFGQADPFAFDPRTLAFAPGARRFDTGTPPIGPAYAARAGIEAVLEAGPAAIGARIESLVGRLLAAGRAHGLEVLGPAEAHRRTPATAFRVPGDSHALEAALRARGVLASARGPALRLAPHFFNTEHEVER
ncbi:MAG: aminotransferase class V-fold PLP-dependent enzyme, partial [Gemmatimonadetes bacterium]